MTRTVVYYTDSQGFGGAEQALLILLEGLERNRWRPVLLHHGYAEQERLLEGARRRGVLTHKCSAVPGSKDIGWLVEFRRLLRSVRADLFHAHLFCPLSCTYALVGAALARVPVVATQHLFWKLKTAHSVRVQKAVSVAVDRYIAVSEQLRREFASSILSPRKVQVIRNGIPFASFERPRDWALRSSLTKGVPRQVVLTVARLQKQKGLRYLVEAAALVPDAVFIVAGDGPDRAVLENQAEATGVADRITFLGHREDVADLLAASDVFVLPSLFEGLPLSVLEAMAAGKPVVATRVGGTDEAVEDGVSGLLVPPQDAGALAGAIKKVISDSDLACRLAETGRARARREFSAETMVGRTVRLYEDLVLQ